MELRHDRPDGEYFAKRTLRRHARVLDLWALGVGAVISGDFFGWNFGLPAGGFGGMLTGLAIMTVLFAALCCSIAEMSSALPHTGGAYSFARTAMGRWGGFVTGLAENLEYILTPAVIVVGVGGYMGAIFGTPSSWAPGWWLLCYLIFVALNVIGVELSFRVSVFVTLCALVVLIMFFICAIPQFDLARWALRMGDGSRTVGAEFCLRCPLPCGYTWVSNNFHWPPRNRMIRFAICPEECFWPWPPW